MSSTKKMLDRLAKSFTRDVAQNIYDLLTPVDMSGRSSNEIINNLKRADQETFDEIKSQPEGELDDLDSFNRIPSDRARRAILYFIEEILGFSEMQVKKKTKITHKVDIENDESDADETLVARYYYVASDRKGLKYRLVITHTFLRLEARYSRPNVKKAGITKKPTYQIYWLPIRVSRKQVDGKNVYVLAKYPETKIYITGDTVKQVKPSDTELDAWNSDYQIGKQNLINLASNLRFVCGLALSSNQELSKALFDSLIFKLFNQYSKLIYSDLKVNILETSKDRRAEPSDDINEEDADIEEMENENTKRTEDANSRARQENIKKAKEANQEKQSSTKTPEIEQVTKTSKKKTGISEDIKTIEDLEKKKDRTAEETSLFMTYSGAKDDINRIEEISKAIIDKKTIDNATTETEIKIILDNINKQIGSLKSFQNYLENRATSKILNNEKNENLEIVKFIKDFIKSGLARQTDVATALVDLEVTSKNKKNEIKVKADAEKRAQEAQGKGSKAKKQATKNEDDQKDQSKKSADDKTKQESKKETDITSKVGKPLEGYTKEVDNIRKRIEKASVIPQLTPIPNEIISLETDFKNLDVQTLITNFTTDEVVKEASQLQTLLESYQRDYNRLIESFTELKTKAIEDRKQAIQSGAEKKDRDVEFNPNNTRDYIKEKFVFYNTRNTPRLIDDFSAFANRLLNVASIGPLAKIRNANFISEVFASDAISSPANQRLLQVAYRGKQSLLDDEIAFRKDLGEQIFYQLRGLYSIIMALSTDTPEISIMAKENIYNFTTIQEAVKKGKIEVVSTLINNSSTYREPSNSNGVVFRIDTDEYKDILVGILKSIYIISEDEDEDEDEDQDQDQDQAYEANKSIQENYESISKINLQDINNIYPVASLWLSPGSSLTAQVRVEFPGAVSNAVLSPEIYKIFCYCHKVGLIYAIISTDKSIDIDYSIDRDQSIEEYFTSLTAATGNVLSLVKLSLISKSESYYLISDILNIKAIKQQVTTFENMQLALMKFFKAIRSVLELLNGLLLTTEGQYGGVDVSHFMRFSPDFTDNIPVPGGVFIDKAFSTQEIITAMRFFFSTIYKKDTGVFQYLLS
jgi:hypothetical protein